MVSLDPAPWSWARAGRVVSMGGQHWVGLNRPPEERLTHRLKRHVLASWGQLALAEEIGELSRREEMQLYFH